MFSILQSTLCSHRPFFVTATTVHCLFVTILILYIAGIVHLCHKCKHLFSNKKSLIAIHVYWIAQGTKERLSTLPKTIFN